MERRYVQRLQILQACVQVLDIRVNALIEGDEFGDQASLELHYEGQHAYAFASRVTTDLSLRWQRARSEAHVRGSATHGAPYAAQQPFLQLVLRIVSAWSQPVITEAGIPLKDMGGNAPRAAPFDNTSPLPILFSSIVSAIVLNAYRVFSTRAASCCGRGCCGVVV
jgi:hypothetical protein